MEKSIEIKIAHLGFIQGVITRMGNNSFLLKGWCVTLIAALFALSAKDANRYFILIAYFPMFMFWWLDAFFLYQEKLYRALYKSVALGITESTAFTLDATSFKSKDINIFLAFFSKTLFPFYGLIILLILLAKEIV